MTRPQPPLAAPPLDWVLVANASRARCFARDADNGALRELANFVHPQSRQKGQALSRDRPGKAFKGQATTQYEPHTDPHDREHEQFARELAAYLEDAALSHRMPGLAIIASSPFLGVLRSSLGDAAARVLRASAAVDLTTVEGPELERRVSAALSSVAA